MTGPPDSDPFENGAASADAGERYPLRRLVLRPAVLVLTGLLILGVVGAIIPVYNPPRPSARIATCANNMKQIGLGFNMYASELGGAFPRVDYATNGALTRPLMHSAEPTGFYPNYFNDPAVLVCPADGLDWPDGLPSDAILDSVVSGSYWYLGHRVEDEPSLLALIAAFLRHEKSGGVFSADFYGDRAIETLFGRFELLRPDDPEAATIPVMIERPKFHTPNDEHFGGNILFLDGHVEYREYPGDFPYSKAVVTALEALDEVSAYRLIHCD